MYPLLGVIEKFSSFLFKSHLNLKLSLQTSSICTNLYYRNGMSPVFLRTTFILRSKLTTTLPNVRCVLSKENSGAIALPLTIQNAST
jgi:hypothetical protein